MSMLNTQQTQQQRVLIMRGEGIECEVESMRFFSAHGLICEWLNMPWLLSDKNYFESLQIQRGDWVFMPGGFSFADHLGSGALAAHHLGKVDFFERVLQKGANLWGVCNGFQTLVCAGLFGKEWSLEPNLKAGAFVNRWVRCRLGSLPALSERASTEQQWQPGETLNLCVRHAEGALTRSISQSDTQKISAKPLLFYDDPDFDNGSWEQVAGLSLQHADTGSWILGLMPHPELSFRRLSQPDFLPGDFPVGRHKVNCFERPQPLWDWTRSLLALK